MWLAGVLAWLAAPVLAQPAPVAAPPADDAGPAVAAPARFQMRIMEGVLESAVQQGAQNLSREMRRVSPGTTFFSGPVRARGFRLDGYGVFFAVDVPALHRSMTWSVRTLTQSNADVSRALQSIRRMVQSQSDARAKSELEQAVRLLELQVRPIVPARPVALPGAGSGDPSVTAERAAVTAAAQDDEPEPDDAPSPLVVNPDAAYTDAVQSAIVDAMLDYGATLNLGAEEWFTVAARENTETMLAGDLTETVTVTLRVRGADLDALKAGRIGRDELRQRVQVRQF
jgi:hypothetical protein